MKILVAYYSMYGHVYKLAQAAAEGAAGVKGAQVLLKRIPETLSKEVLGIMGALDSQKEQENVLLCTVDDLATADAVIFGTPTRFGNMCGQMRQFLDATGGLWLKGAMVARSAASLPVPPPSMAGRNPRSFLSTSRSCTKAW